MMSGYYISVVPMNTKSTNKLLKCYFVSKLERVCTQVWCLFIMMNAHMSYVLFTAHVNVVYSPW